MKIRKLSFVKKSSLSMIWLIYIGHSIYKTFHRQDIPQIGHYIDRTLHRQDIPYIGHFIDRKFHRQDIPYIGHSIYRTFHRKDIPQIGHSIDKTFNKPRIFSIDRGDFLSTIFFSQIFHVNTPHIHCYNETIDINITYKQYLI